MKPKQIETQIDNDLKTRIGYNKKTDVKDAEENEQKALKDITKRKFMNDIRPPHYWNFIEDGPEENRVQHVMRYNAKPTECYEDGRVEKILQYIEEIGMSLQSFEEDKWKTLRLRTLDVFKQEFLDYKKKLEES